MKFLANENYSQKTKMIVQTQTSILTQLMATDCRHDRRQFMDAVKDALIMVREAALIPTRQSSVSNDRTTLKHQKRF